MRLTLPTAGPLRTPPFTQRSGVGRKNATDYWKVLCYKLKHVNMN